MKNTLIFSGFACLLSVTTASFAQSASSAAGMGTPKRVGVSASTAAEAQQKAATNAPGNTNIGNVGTVVRTGEGPGAKAARAKDSAMDHTKMGSHTDHPGAAASGAPMSK